jgi:HEPN domain-containing protein
MSENRYPPDDPQEWLNRAKSNLIKAKYVKAGIYLEDLCFDAQQAAEKAIKAALIRQGQRFPYIHDIGELLALLEQTGVKIPDFLSQAAKLTRYAVAVRYPGVIERVTQSEYKDAILIAENVVTWVESLIRAER